MNELIELKKAKETINKIWAKSMATIIALILGIMAGLLIKESEIIDDCKYTNNFRIGSQSFTCQRRM